MRTTLNIEDDVFAVVKVIAESTSQSIGKVASDLIREGLKKHNDFDYKNGIPTFEVSEKASVITINDVKKDEDE